MSEAPKNCPGNDCPERKFVGFISTQRGEVRTVTFSCTPVYVCDAVLRKTTYGYGSEKPIVSQEVFTDFFKLREIPDVMTKSGWVVAAKVQNAWFNGAELEFTEEQRQGKNLPASAIRTDLITWKWLSTFDEFNNGLSKLIQEKAFGEVARGPKGILKILNRLATSGEFTFKKGQTEIHFVNSFGPNNIHQSHLNWQFQFVKIFDGWKEKPMSSSSVTDLFAALGSFTVNVAIHEMRVTKGARSNSVKVSIKKVAVYAKDTYDFFGEQYLGHWGRDGLQLPFFKAAWNGFWGDESKTLVTGTFSEFKQGKNVFFPVGNTDYRSWRNKNHQGGDMMLYSDVKYYEADDKLDFEIVVPNKG